MTRYRIFRMKENDRLRFRWQPHTSGASVAKPKEYEERGAVEAESPYAAWALLKETELPLQVGDILVGVNDELLLFKYVGFEEAKWHIPEVKTGIEMLPAAAGSASFPPA